LGTPTLVELSSALQPIAIAYLLAFFLVRQSPKVQAAVGGGILFGYALLLALVPAPGVAAGSYEKGANLVLAVDVAVLGRAHQEGWGTVLSTIPTISTTILGLLLGELLMSKRPPKRKALIIALIGVCGVTVGMMLDPMIPVIMKLWTTSYGILTAGWACLLFAAFYWIIDVQGYKKWAFPLAVIGMNALAIYMSRTLIPLSKTVGIFTGGIARELGSLGPMFHGLAVLFVEWLILYWMYKRKIFLRA
jgi:predicted acyltransferase